MRDLGHGEGGIAEIFGGAADAGLTDIAMERFPGRLPDETIDMVGVIMEATCQLLSGQRLTAVGIDIRKEIADEGIRVGDSHFRAIEGDYDLGKERHGSGPRSRCAVPHTPSTGS